MPSPSATTAMLIRRPVAEVFEAFINPAITAKFWFSKGSARLTAGARVTWHWEMYGHAIEATVKQVVLNHRIVVEWEAYGAPTPIEWAFDALTDSTTFVSTTCSGFVGSADEISAQMVDNTEGFTFVLAGLKAWLEHGIELHLVRDRHPSLWAKPDGAI